MKNNVVAILIRAMRAVLRDINDGTSLNKDHESIRRLAQLVKRYG